MPNFCVDLTEMEIIQILGKWAEKRYDLQAGEATVGWKGPQPEGVSIVSKPTRDPYKNLFED
jgi:hypothetical protein